jgi:hypothetical protein
MKTVYTLSKALELDPKRIELARKLTLDKSRPRLGLRGRYGLFASEEWWQNIQCEKIKMRYWLFEVMRRIWLNLQKMLKVFEEYLFIALILS